MVRVIIFNIHLSHSQNGGYFCTQYIFVSQGLQGLTVDRTLDSYTIHNYIVTYTLLRIATGSSQLTNVCLAQVRPNYIEY